MHELVRICQHPHSLTLISPDPSLHNQSQNGNESWGSADQSVIWLRNTHRLQRKQSIQGEKDTIARHAQQQTSNPKIKSWEERGGKKNPETADLLNKFTCPSRGLRSREDNAKPRE
jgi:hypothetical protein